MVRRLSAAGTLTRFGQLPRRHVRSEAPRRFWRTPTDPGVPAFESNLDHRTARRARDPRGCALNSGGFGSAGLTHLSAGAAPPSAPAPPSPRPHAGAPRGPRGPSRPGVPPWVWRHTERARSLHRNDSRRNSESETPAKCTFGTQSGSAESRHSKKT